MFHHLNLGEKRFSNFRKSFFIVLILLLAKFSFGMIRHLLQECRKIRGLGCVNRARARGRVTQPSPRIFLHICRWIGRVRCQMRVTTWRWMHLATRETGLLTYAVVASSNFQFWLENKLAHVVSFWPRNTWSAWIPARAQKMWHQLKIKDLFRLLVTALPFSVSFFLMFR